VLEFAMIIKKIRTAHTF